VRNDTDRLSTEELLTTLNRMQERPWPTWRRGAPLDARALAKLLGAFGVRSRDMRQEGRPGAVKGYLRASFEDAWQRYLPQSDSGETPADSGSQSATPRQANNSAGSSEIRIRDKSDSVADQNCPGNEEKPGLSRCRGSETPSGGANGVVAHEAGIEEGVE
jgi:hypothetical protein